MAVTAIVMRIISGPSKAIRRLSAHSPAILTSAQVPALPMPSPTELPKGESVVVLSQSDGWSHILYNGTKTGYVSTQYPEYESVCAYFHEPAQF